MVVYYNTGRVFSQPKAFVLAFSDDVTYGDFVFGKVSEKLASLRFSRFRYVRKSHLILIGMKFI